MNHNYCSGAVTRLSAFLPKLAVIGWVLIICLASSGVYAGPPTGHALIITIGTYEDRSLVSLPGTRADRESARQIATGMQIPEKNIIWLSDTEATGVGIREALTRLNRRVMPGDRVYLHFSGHGVRRYDPSIKACTEAFLAHDDKPDSQLSNSELATLLEPIARKTDKLFVMYDACHSGGMTTASRRPTRSWTALADAGTLRPRSAPTEDRCTIASNIRTRNLLVEQTERGALPQDIVYLAAARPDEISLDDEVKGGLATQYVRDCMLKDAVDSNGSGTIDIGEIKACAQTKINARLEKDDTFKPHNLVLDGNPAFVPAWFDKPLSAQHPSKPFSAQAALMEIFNQSNGKLAPVVKPNKAMLRINHDSLELYIKADKPGWLYVFAAGTDDKHLNLLFPNAVDQAHRIEAKQNLTVPRAHWKLAARGPQGINRVMVVQTPSPLPAVLFTGQGQGDFLFIANKSATRAKLAQALSASTESGCAQADECIRGYGATLMDITETP